MKEKAVVIINKAHTLKSEQISLLQANFSSYERLDVPETGWTKAQMDSVIVRMFNFDGVIVFASPIPYLIKFMTEERYRKDDDRYPKIYIFHNDTREAKELPNGKIIHTVAETGWELV